MPKTEGKITPARYMGMRGATSSGSENSACSEGYQLNGGDPISSSGEKYHPTRLNTEEDEKANGESASP